MRSAYECRVAEDFDNILAVGHQGASVGERPAGAGYGQSALGRELDDPSHARDHEGTPNHKDGISAGRADAGEGCVEVCGATDAESLDAHTDRGSRLLEGLPTGICPTAPVEEDGDARDLRQHLLEQ